MRDVLRLRDQIRHAALLMPFALSVAACAKDESAAPTNVSVPPGGSATTAAIATAPSDTTSASAMTTASTGATTDPTPDQTDDASVAVITPVMRHPFPSCPHGMFCTSKKAVAKYAEKGSAVSLDCPTTISARDRSDALPGMPHSSRTRLSFSESDTMDARSDAGAADQCCYTWAIPCPGGRPLMNEDAPVTARAREGASWCRPTREKDRVARSASIYAKSYAPETRALLADAWLGDALAEHASIASFARATLELMAVGAPAALVASCQRAALDEVRHAEHCFDLARFYGGVALEPGPLAVLAPRATDFARLARDTFVEGCVGETLSALCATRAAARAMREPNRESDDGIGDGAREPKADRDAACTWRLLAHDEAEHAAFAWRTIAWILRQNDADFAFDLFTFAQGLADDARVAIEHAMTDASSGGALPGRLSAREQTHAHLDAWREIIMPTLHALLNERTTAPSALSGGTDHRACGQVRAREDSPSPRSRAAQSTHSGSADR